MQQPAVFRAHRGQDRRRRGRRSPGPASRAISATRCSASAGDAVEVWDAVFDAGTPPRLDPVRPDRAVDGAHRGRACCCCDVDFDVEPLRRERRTTARHRSNSDSDWMFARASTDDSRPFIGRRAILPRACRRHVTLEDDGPDGRSGGLRHRSTPRAGMIATEGPRPRRRRHDAVRLRRQRRSATRRASCTHRCCSGTSRIARVRPDLAASGTRVNLEFTINHALRAGRRSTSSASRMFNPSTQDRPDERRSTMTDQPRRTTRSSSAEATTGWSTARYLAKAGLRHADPRTAPPRRRRGDHRGAPARIQVHHVLLRAEPAAARHHPRARPREARIHAAADAVVVLARWTTATRS